MNWIMRPYRAEIFLLLNHLAFAGIFTWYLQSHGGDAIRYWELRAETGHDPQTWSEHWGTRSFFVQWLNYLPAKVLRLPFWAGNLLYALLSSVAILQLWRWYASYCSQNGLSPLWGFLVFLLPNLHFWTAGVSKEALALLGLVAWLRGTWMARHRWDVLFLMFGLGISYMVRPLHGLVLLGFTLGWVLLRPGISQAMKWALAFVSIGLMASMLLFLKYITHMQAWSWQALMAFSESQLRFLEGFSASSEVPMREYGFWKRLVVVWFSPMPWEAEGVWQWAAALENLLLFLAFFVMVLYFFYHKSLKLPRFVWWGLLFGIFLSAVYLLTLNNWGLFMRMKSFYTVFYYLGAVLVLSQWSVKKNAIPL